MANGRYAGDGSWRGIDTDTLGHGLVYGDGSLRMTVATTEKGYYAPDGSIYIEKIANGTTGNGVYNGRGNLRVVRAEVVTGNGLQAQNGAIRITGLSA